jgi:hypothetical protein
MQFARLKSIQVFSDGSLLFCSTSFVRFQAIIILEKDFRNLKLSRDTKFNGFTKSKSFFNDKSKYLLISKSFKCY